MSKIKIAVVFGGRSGEHEVSLVSASSVIKALDKNKYEIQEIGISYDGIWLSGENCLKKFKSEDLSALNEIYFSNDISNPNRPDIVFPVLHGPFGEDGTIQGMLEMLRIPYVGCGVMASAVAMDKLQCKRLWESAGLPVVPWVDFIRSQWEVNSNAIMDDIKSELSFPCFVKPVNMGSSVGITKVHSFDELRKAIDFALNFDSKILVEKALNVREIECAILGNENPVSAPLGEVLVGGEFYDFNDKYINGVSKTQIPAEISEDLAKLITHNCLKAYSLLDCSGLSRVDTFLDLDSGYVYLNEINTMPGFTSISMYPKMMETFGLSYSNLVDKLIKFGFDRFKDRQKNKVRFDSDSDWFKS